MGGRRLLHSHPILVARGQAYPSFPEVRAQRILRAKSDAQSRCDPHPRAAPAVHQRGLLGCPVLLIATALGSGSPECNHTGSAGPENPNGLCKPLSALIGSIALVRSLHKLSPLPPALLCAPAGLWLRPPKPKSELSPQCPSSDLGYCGAEGVLLQWPAAFFTKQN